MTNAHAISKRRRLRAVYRKRLNVPPGDCCSSFRLPRFLASYSSSLATCPAEPTRAVVAKYLRSSSAVKVPAISATKSGSFSAHSGPGIGGANVVQQLFAD